MKRHWRSALCALSLTMAVASGSATAQTIPLVTGEQWNRSAPELKKAYLIGIANLAHVEMAYGEADPADDSRSIVPRLVRGLHGQTLDTVREGLDAWYAAHPEQLQRPVFETLWFEMVVPGLAGGN